VQVTARAPLDGVERWEMTYGAGKGGREGGYAALDGGDGGMVCLGAAFVCDVQVTIWVNSGVTLVRDIQGWCLGETAIRTAWATGNALSSIVWSCSTFDARNLPRRRQGTSLMMLGRALLHLGAGSKPTWSCRRCVCPGSDPLVAPRLLNQRNKSWSLRGVRAVFSEEKVRALGRGTDEFSRRLTTCKVQHADRTIRQGFWRPHLVGRQARGCLPDVQWREYLAHKETRKFLVDATAAHVHLRKTKQKKIATRGANMPSGMSARVGETAIVSSCGAS